MANLHNYDTDHPAEMDYPQHEKTYELFLNLTKWGTIAVVAILLGMLVGLIGSGGFFGGILTFVVVLALAYFFAR